MSLVSMDYKIVIPARFGSSRLPGKPLLNIAGKPMVQHVYERAQETGVSEIVVATDDQRIFDAVMSFGGEAVLTRADHETGTDRIAEVALFKGWDDDVVIVNLQGDEPLIPPELIELTAKGLIEHQDAGMSSLCTPIDNADDLFDANIVKVVMDYQGYAMYFSRASIPWDRDVFAKGQSLPSKMSPCRHIGMYGYRVSFLKAYAKMTPCDIEQTESLEQLRALWYGHRIHMGVIESAPGHGVDTQDDLDRVEQLMLDRI
jgi:3-deoxy-manno-octulosonate cytidylyltransferase (CMP-KDO synthetase)